MNYGKYESGALHISATQKEGYKPITVSKPEGFKDYTFTGYTETDTEIHMTYEAVVDTRDNTLQRLADLESRMDLTEGAVQEMILGEGAETNESEVSGSTN